MGEFTIYLDIETVLEAIGMDEKTAYEMRRKYTGKKKYLPVKADVEMDDPYVFLDSCGASMEAPCKHSNGRHSIILDETGVRRTG